MSTTPIATKINEAIAATEPKTKERNKALSAVRWVLICASGYAALTQDARCIIVEDIADAQVFDGRDNEAMKAKFYSVMLKTNCEPMLLP